MPSSSAEAVSFDEQGVRGFLHPQPPDADDGLVLTHGAGGNCNAPLLVAAAKAFHAAGLVVLRCDLPFRWERRGPPSPGGAAADRAGLKKAVDALRAIVPRHVYLGGHSYGGRQASMLAADQPKLAEALLLLSYPLHPPGKPTQLRIAHFPSLTTRAVFVHGSTDPFGSLAEMSAALDLIPSEKELIVVEGAGHDLKRGRFDLNKLVDALLRSRQ
ncbi:MAG TPA: alpha/beta family hydrolase [Roseiarcus sp.]|nr:alpha/beta family hydrolase [Roseiarcus sp.]